MTVQATALRNPTSDDDSLLLDRSSLFVQRTSAVAAQAAAEADEVDREGRFPTAAIDAAREHKLLGMQIPVAFGGFGASVHDVADVCYALGRACASSAMIFAMHQTKVACLVRHGRGNAYMESLMRRIASEQLLMASSTTEGQNGGNIRASAAAVGHDGEHITLRRDATVISYGAEADGLVTIARRADGAAASDQVLLALTTDDYTIARTQGWETLGMRGTCSTGFALEVSCPSDRMFTESYDRIHG